MALLEVLLPAVVGGLFGLMQPEPEIPEPRSHVDPSRSLFHRTLRVVLLCQ